jgi:CheY-like chemotaxis protein
MANPKILLVEDDNFVRSMMGEELKQHGFDVTTAGSVSEALQHIMANVYDVMLSDLHMPGAGDGLTVVSALHHSNPKAVTMFKQRSLSPLISPVDGSIGDDGMEALEMQVMA